MPAQTRVIHFYVCLGAAGGKECEVIMDNKNFNFPDDKIFQYITYGIVLGFILFNLESVWDFFLNILGLARPFYIAIVIAFVINIPMKLVEKLLVKAKGQWMKKNPDSKLPKFLLEGTRGMAMTITIVCINLNKS